jgi:signal transduction histidine kinase
MTDDGQLKDLSEIDSKGNGVRNIKKRTQRNDGICNFTINPNGHGLVIELKFPIS